MDYYKQMRQEQSQKHTKPITKYYTLPHKITKSVLGRHMQSIILPIVTIFSRQTQKLVCFVLTTLFLLI